MFLPLILVTVVSVAHAGQTLGELKACVTSLGHSCIDQCTRSSGYDSSGIKQCSQSMAANVYDKYIQCWRDHGDTSVNNNAQCWQVDLGAPDAANPLAALTPFTAYVECMKSCGRPKLESCNSRCTARGPTNQSVKKLCGDQFDQNARQGAVQCLGKAG